MAKTPGNKTHNLALLLPLTGLFLLMPPAVLAFSMPGTLAGVPFIVLYIFSIWGLLIIGTAWLARRMEPPIPMTSRPSPLDQDQPD